MNGTPDMNILPSLRVVLDELTQRFGAQIEHAQAPQPNELYLHTRQELASALCSIFYKKHGGRLAGVFAEDARAGQQVFFVYYLYALDAAHGFVFVRVPIPQCVRLAESISGDSGFAHTTAFCHAIERAAGVEAPPRARALRTLCLELERLYNHVADIGAICTDVAFVSANMHAMRLKERALRVNEQLTGNRLLRGMARLGGVRFDFDAGQLRALAQLVDEFEPQFNELVELIRHNSGTRDRLETTGVLKPEVARRLGVVGLAGRASGFDHDLRRDFPHAFYDDVQFKVPVFDAGDVQHRMVVRREELFQSFEIIRQVLRKLPAGPIYADISEVPPDRVALGYVEGWRGEIFHWGHTAPGNRLARCKVKD